MGGRASWRVIGPASPCSMRLGGRLALPIPAGFEFFHTFLVTWGEEIALVVTTNLFSSSSWVCPPARKSPRRATVVAEKSARRGYQDGDHASRKIRATMARILPVNDSNFATPRSGIRCADPLSAEADNRDFEASRAQLHVADSRSTAGSIEEKTHCFPPRYAVTPPLLRRPREQGRCRKSSVYSRRQRPSLINRQKVPRNIGPRWWCRILRASDAVGRGSSKLHITRVPAAALAARQSGVEGVDDLASVVALELRVHEMARLRWSHRWQAAGCDAPCGVHSQAVV